MTIEKNKRLARLLKLRQQQCDRELGLNLKRVRSAVHSQEILQQALRDSSTLTTPKVLSSDCGSAAKLLQTQQNFLCSVHQAIDATVVQQHSDQQASQNLLKRRRLLRSYHNKLTLAVQRAEEDY